jgi:isopenicillin N synthase-like dioxygenase
VSKLLERLRGGQGEDWKLRIQGIRAQTLSISDVKLIDITDPYSSASVDEARRNLNTYGFMMFSLDSESAKLFGNLQDEARKYFDLPLEEKMQFAATEHIQGKFGNRGYFPYGTEVPSATSYPDPKEYLHIGAKTTLGSDEAKAFGYSDFSKLLPNAREVFLNSYDRFQEIADMGIRVALMTVDIDTVSPALVAPITNSVLRLIHYPAMTDEEASKFSMRAAPHKGFHTNPHSKVSH